MISEIIESIVGKEAEKIMAEVVDKFAATPLTAVVPALKAAEETFTPDTDVVSCEAPGFTVNAGGGKKQTGGKPTFNQVPEAFVAALSKHMDIGSIKYGFANWTKGMTESQVLEADHRHSAKRRAGEDIDPDTGSSHYLAKAANAMMAWSLEQAGKLEDDRTTVYVDSFVKKAGTK